MILTYKYRIKDSSARKILRQRAIAVNQVWNYCNALQRESLDRYKSGRKVGRWLTRFDLGCLTAGSSKVVGIHAHTIGEVCRQFAASRNKSQGRLRFRASFGTKRSLGWIPFKKETRQIDGNSVTYMGQKFRFYGNKRRPLPDNARGGAFVEDARGRWYVTFYCEVASLPTGVGKTGIDLGLKALGTCSNGDVIPAIQHYRRYEAALATAQRAGNKHRAKAIHAQIANARRDQLHKASCKIARENSLIVVGNVNAAKLKKTRMAKSVSDAGWSMFRTMLRYKASRHGATFIEADERFTSQLCSECGSISGPKGIAQLGIRYWECSECGAPHDRDVNAAKNILNVALSAQRRVDESRRDAA